MDLDHVVFTGHAETGRKLAAHLGDRLISSTLELSGCDLMLVLEDADLELAARAAWFGATLNRGQTCLAVRRVFVPRVRYDEFLRRLEPLVLAATPLPLALPPQAEQARRLIQDALVEGARLLQAARTTWDGFENRPTHFLPAAVADARPDMSIATEASFAPILAVIPYGSIEEAIAAQRYCACGLGASIFTGNPARAARLAAHLQAGVVTINDVIVASAHPATPFGGRGASGWGVTQGLEGLLEMTLPQVVSIRGGNWRPHYAPADSTVWTRQAVLENLLRWAHAGSWFTRIKAGFGLLRQFVRLPKLWPAKPVWDSSTEARGGR
jgi:acyl-CoA reductase-like NAD-dependent aldehyde dehydrogenase